MRPTYLQQRGGRVVTSIFFFTVVIVAAASPVRAASASAASSAAQYNESRPGLPVLCGTPDALLLAADDKQEQYSRGSFVRSVLQASQASQPPSSPMPEAPPSQAIQTTSAKTDESSSSKSSHKDLTPLSGNDIAMVRIKVGKLHFVLQICFLRAMFFVSSHPSR